LLVIAEQLKNRANRLNWLALFFYAVLHGSKNGQSVISIKHVKRKPMRKEKTKKE